MSFFRTAVSRSIRIPAARTYATTPAKKSSNLPFVLLTAGVALGGAYWYLDQSQAPVKPKQEKSPLDPQNFIDFKLKKVVPYNHNSSIFSYPITSCLVVKASDPEALKDAKGKPIIRPIPPYLEYDTGNMSKIHSLSQGEGDTLAIKGPIPKFPYTANEFDEVALIGGGRNKTKFKLLFGNITEDDILSPQRVGRIESENTQTTLMSSTFLTVQAGWTGPSGFITADLLKKHVAPADLKGKVKVFVCGPPPQVASIAGKKAGMKQGEIGGILKELGYTEDQVFKF
ncbi:cytochrome-b5 reductase [Gymnopilus junonius]|uniref:Cytochrome-b5 reductase n=1 Tax=Gymnopilus junonius TaxID=109634 RepID=A0A9P5TF61_GYMJU|nr:cytochrome-b5 reductase [Gymnopilus junonius]